ncbi:Hcp family type VI secretion system effector [Xenorhabdus sp. DI]|uniref:Hcp family type VI secretion system effector n=1 Tax=Xenorhabdus doucetiae TaxID=351671 RepID=UPI0019B719D2|nr:MULTISPECIES: Hcp family type VI secretion system effector [unclassified Xenorhabdus]MBD2784627.1 Hcp family type VI secretion system effector [Xenorhabdus sp. 3]MBD2788276.1 Hcp family type VI secretion system effector [Xenorhabdus sp. DI]
MANSIYVTIKGKLQGLISQGCSTLDSIGNKFQLGHEDQIFVLQFNHGISRSQNVAHQPVKFVKPLDKSSPLLMMAISNNEELDLMFEFYRTSQAGSQERFYSVNLRNAKLLNLNVQYPHSVNHHDQQPEEVVAVRYKDIVCQHHIAGTSGYCVWEDTVY